MLWNPKRPLIHRTAFGGIYSSYSNKAAKVKILKSGYSIKATNYQVVIIQAFIGKNLLKYTLI